MKLELKYQTSIIFIFVLIALIPKISKGQDSLQAVGTVRDSTITSINADVMPDSVVRPADKGKPKENNINYWGTAGLNITGGLTEINVVANKNLFSAYYSEFQKWDNEKFISETKPDPRFKELGLLYGRVLTKSERCFYCSISGGIARMIVKDWKLVSVETYDSFFGWYTNNEYEDYEYNVYGCPIKCKIMWRGKYFGLGFDVIANINSISNYTDLKLHISLGKLK